MERRVQKAVPPYLAHLYCQFDQDPDPDGDQAGAADLGHDSLVCGG